MKKTNIFFILTLLFFSFSLQSQDYANPGGIINTCTGVFTDTGGSTGNYMNAETETTTFCSDNGDVISLNFTSFNTEEDFDLLKIYDGIDNSAPALHSGLGFTGTNNPGIITSSGTCLTFVFTSDGGINSIGWSATISCGEGGTGNPTEYNNPGGTINTCSGVFMDTGGSTSNYMNAENVVTTFCSDNGDVISLNFTSFSTEVDFDDLTIYDGNDISAPSLGVFTGTISPGLVSSAAGGSGCLTFEFKSDSGVNSAGWIAEISCNTEPPVCIGTTPCSNVPDICADACDLSLLSTPAACPTGGSISDVFCINNIGAMAELPYSYLVACEDGNDMPNPSADVWYSFVATGDMTTINITGLLNPSLGVYEGSSCNAKIGRGCDNGFGSLSLKINPTTSGSTYFLQISGGDESDVGDMELEIISEENCVDCLVASSLVSNPPSVNGKYNPGETIEFCYTIDKWGATSDNWLHSVVPTLGSGWDASSLVPTSIPSSCDAPGVWDWYTTITGTNVTPNNAGIVGPGFAFESPVGSPFGMMDNNPGNNFGDAGNVTDCPDGATWTFCWEVTAQDCASIGGGADLSISVETYGDSETGGYNLPACENDLIYQMQATAAECCAETPMPQNLSHKLEAPARCKIKWDAIPGAIKYDVHYRIQGTTPWTRVTTFNNNRTLTNLAPNTIYQYRVRASCDGTWTFANASDLRRFNTANIPGATAREIDIDLDLLTIFPNPARESIHINYTIQELSNASIRITDMTGKVILEKELGQIEGEQSSVINLSTINAGYYILAIESGGNRIAKRFVKIE